VEVRCGGVSHENGSELRLRLNLCFTFGTFGKTFEHQSAGKTTHNPSKKTRRNSEVDMLD